MPAVPDFAARRFQSAAAHYLGGRAPYPEGLIARTAQILPLGPNDRLMDLGCGPAQLAAAFAPLVGEVLALDPEPAMLALAREATAHLAKVTVAEGRSDDLGSRMGRFQAVVIGRAFHWMDRAETLGRLEQLIEPHGALVLFGDERPDIPDNAWAKAFEALIERYSEDDPVRRLRRADSFTPHISVLLASSFNRLERISLIGRRTLTADSLVQRALSLSSTSRARLGDKADVMIAEIEAFTEAAQADGPLIEVLTSSALIARRG